jgi:hypothetical protein
VLAAERQAELDKLQPNEVTGKGCVLKALEEGGEPVRASSPVMNSVFLRLFLCECGARRLRTINQRLCFLSVVVALL